MNSLDLRDESAVDEALVAVDAAPFEIVAALWLGHPVGYNVASVASSRGPDHRESDASDKRPARHHRPMREWDRGQHGRMHGLDAVAPVGAGTYGLLGEQRG